MLNYVKSEFYRILHSPALYILAISFAALALLLNLTLYSFMVSDPTFMYSTTSFSYSNIVANPMFFCVCALIVVLAFYEDNRKNGNLKNVIASGISREKIFVGQFIVSFTAAVVILIITEAVYIFSAELLLRHEGAVEIKDMINEAFAVFPTAVSALILGIFVKSFFEKTSVGILLWLSVMFFIPQFLFYLGLKVEPIRNIAAWLPRNLFNYMEVNPVVCNPIWNKPEGLFRCMVSGFASTVIFSVLGIMTFRKKEL